MRDDTDLLRPYFDKVHNPENWKRSIDAIVTAEDLALTIRAILWFAGSKSTVVPLDDERFQVTAPGYYADVGA